MSIASLLSITPEIRTTRLKQLAGARIQTSLINNKTFELWSGFMPRRKEITNAAGTELYSVQVYPASYSFSRFDPAALFDKWAAVEINDTAKIPAEMETLLLPAGLYAVFIHKGAADTAPQTFGYIYGTWLPASAYELDTRPHFEILGDKYKNNDPSSEEEVWVPIRKKQ
jgi:AraC family transcriptional regulator